MKVVNLMNFVRQIDEREPDSTRRLLEMTTKQLRLANKYGVDNTLLLQYDALCDKDFVSLFQQEASDQTELGLWYEIVEPLATACGIPYRSEQGWKWDWHIIPGFSMAYTPRQREQLIDEAMRKFRETFGCYPRTVASWLIDTHTLNYLSRHYDIRCAAICRDQANTDAYTLLGGYFDQAYYPSKNNIFTPAQSPQLQTDVPVFRLLGPCPIHNHDNDRYSSEAVRALGRRSACFTLEPCWYMGSTPEITQWMFDTFYSQESLGFAYAQIGQENSFFLSMDQVLEGTELQIRQLLSRGDVSFRKMSDTGDAFRARYPHGTPATSVVALSNWDTTDAQSVYYDCKNYTANLFRFEDRIFLRSLYLFDERVKDRYLEDTCTTFDAVYENLPIVDTMVCDDKDRKNCGLIIGGPGEPFKAKAVSEGVLEVSFGDRSVTFFEDRIEIRAARLTICANSLRAEAQICPQGLELSYNGTGYYLAAEGARIYRLGNDIVMGATGDKIRLFPRKQSEAHR